MERLLSKVAYRSLNARDCIALKNSLQRVPGIRQLLQGVESDSLCKVRNGLNVLEDLA